MLAIETTARFDEDGKLTIDNLPEFKNKNVKLLFLLSEKENENWYSVSSQGISNAYSSNEPEYQISLVTEPNDNYGAEGR